MKLCFESSDCVETFFWAADLMRSRDCAAWFGARNSVLLAAKHAASIQHRLPCYTPTTPCRAMSCRGPTKQQLHLPHSQRCPKGILRHTAAYCGILTAKRQWHWKWHWSNVQISALWNCVASRMSKCKLWSAPPWGVALKQRCNPSFWFFFVFVLEKHLCPGFCLHV